MGLDFIITDHHEPGLDLPEEAILVNPKFMADGRNLGDLAGVGVAFKLAQAVEEESGLLPVVRDPGGSYLDLVALGTIADVVPLTGETGSGYARIETFIPDQEGRSKSLVAGYRVGR